MLRSINQFLPFFQLQACISIYCYSALLSWPKVFSQGNFIPRKVHDLHEKALSMRFCLFIVQLTVV
jgi:hypothetical protein